MDKNELTLLNEEEVKERKGLDLSGVFNTLDQNQRQNCFYAIIGTIITCFSISKITDCINVNNTLNKGGTYKSHLCAVKQDSVENHN